MGDISGASSVSLCTGAAGKAGTGKPEGGACLGGGGVHSNPACACGAVPTNTAALIIIATDTDALAPPSHFFTIIAFLDEFSP